MRLNPWIVIVSAEIFRTGILLPSASGTVTTLMLWRPVNDSDWLPNWAGGRVNTGAEPSGAAGVGAGVGVAAVPGTVGVGVGRPGSGSPGAGDPKTVRATAWGLASCTT